MALLTQQNIGNRLSWIIFIVIYIQTVQTLATYSDIPRKLISLIIILLFSLLFLFLAPPPRPDRFHSRDELRQYLQRVRIHIFLSYISHFLHPFSFYLRCMNIMLSLDDHVLAALLAI